MSLAALLVLVLGATACVGSLERPERFADGGGRMCAPGFSVERDIFARTCATVGCHDMAQAASGLVLTGGNIAARMVGVHAQTPGCTDALLIDPANVAASFVLAKVATPPTGCGGRMPLVGARLTQAEIDCLYLWAQSAVSSPGMDASVGDAAASTDGGMDP